MEKLRDKIKKVYDGFDKGLVKNIIFTTYGFSPKFFQDSIITYLMGKDKIGTIKDLKDADKWIKDNGVNVFYDKNGAYDLDAAITLDSNAVNIKTGVFHPKLIVIYGMKNGEECVWLFVSSANLTVSGYGVNIEGVYEGEVTEKQVAKELREFLKYLYEEWDIKSPNGEIRKEVEPLLKYLNKRKFDDTQGIELFCNNGGAGSKSLIKKFSGMKGEVRIISPYFSEDIESLIYELAEEKRNITIIPALNGDKFQITKETYKRLKDNGVCFKMIDSTRFPHVKMYKVGSSIVVGSHNFTGNALKDLNCEASIIIKNKRFPEISLIDINNDEMFCDEFNEVSNKDEIRITKNNIYITVEVDWKEKEIKINSEKLSKNRKVYIKIGECKISKEKFNESLPMEFIKNYDNTKVLAETILINKYFEVFEDDIRIYRGIICERNWEEYRPEIRCNGLDEALEEWFYSNNIDDISNNPSWNLRPIGNDIEDEYINNIQVNGREKSDVFDNYFYIFRSLHSINKAIENNKDNHERELYEIFRTLPNSIYNIRELAKKIKYETNGSKEDERIKKWIIFNELLMSTSLIKEKLNISNVRFLVEIKKMEEELTKNISINEKALNTMRGVKFVRWLKEEFGYK